MGAADFARTLAQTAMKVTVTIPKTQEAKEDGKPFTFYMLHVNVEDSPDDTMVVPRRYRDFEALRNDLIVEFPMIFDKKQNPDAPDLPAKQFFGNMAPDVIANRRDKLEKFLQQCLTFEEVLMESANFGKFLQLDG